MKRVTIHLRQQTALTLTTASFDRLANGDTRSDADLVYFRELQRALTQAMVSVATKVRKTRPKKAADVRARAAKRDETTAIRAAAMRRSLGFCECGCGLRLTSSDPGAMDHYFGRAKVRQRLENVWILSRSCDRAKTENKPSASYWLGRFIEHADRHGYSAEAERARDRREALAEVQQAAAISRGDHPP